jgi:DNA-binding transcriptional LysR family regulator
VEPPLALPEMPMYMVWHARHQLDAAHQWLRAEVEAVVGDVVT